LIKRSLYIVFLLTVILSNARADDLRNREGKGPRGLYVFSDQLKQIFPYADVKKVPGTIYQSLENKTFSNKLYLVTVSDFLPTLSDLQMLKSFARDGNTVFISCYGLSQETRDFFDVADSALYIGTKDSFKLEKDGQWALGSFSSRMYLGFENCFYNISGKKTVVLGRTANGKANFIRIPYGSGNVYIHLLPFVFTNYFLLEKENYKYTQAILSYVPKSVNEILWKLPRYRRNSGGSSSYNGNEKSEFSFMSTVWANPNLRSAFLLGLLVLLLLLLFGSKRRQRVIPVVEPLQNTTFEFAQTMGDLYFNQHNNTAMADKKIKYWQEHVRNNYNLSTREMNREFWDNLGKKSGLAPQVIKDLELSIIRARNQRELSDRDMVHLNNSIDQFYKS
jgi:hypothetical protein